MGWGDIRRDLEAAAYACAAQLPVAFLVWWIGSFAEDDYGSGYGGALGFACLCLFLPLLLPVLGLVHALVHLVPGWTLALPLARRFPGRPRWVWRLLGTTVVAALWAAPAALLLGRPFVTTAPVLAASGVWPVLWCGFVRRRAERTGRSWGCLGLGLASALTCVGLCVLTLLGGLLATATGLVREYEPPRLSAARLTGVWRGADGAVLRLLPGGRAEATDAPVTAPDGWDFATCEGTRTGTWRAGHRDGRDGVSVALGDGCGEELFWSAGGTAREPELFATAGDPDAPALRVLERD
ncbi:hypothetical protein AB0K92_05240 [Streptomyces sp. NPDC052687]|uniref:hypothetical protein n=1 Tax=Streptomyces sp. NPDC052687 TaxID=3154759 RepID=UPI00341C810B